MDKKNLTIGILLIVAAIGVFKFMPKPQPAPPAPATASASAAPAPAASAQPAASLPGAAASASLVSESTDAQFTTLSNDYIEARFTNHGGAIVDIAFKKYTAAQGQPGPFIFNKQHIDPIFAFTTDAFTARKLDRDATYKLVSSSPTEVVYSTTVEDGANRVEVRRTYSIVPAGAKVAADDPAGDPYRIRQEISFINLTDHATPLPAFSFNIGTVALDSLSRFTSMYLSAGCNNGDKTSFVYHSELEGGAGFLGMNPTAPVPYLATPGKTAWASVSNQFFAGILMPDAPGTGIVTRRVDLPPLPDTTAPVSGLSVEFAYGVPVLAPNGSATLGFNYYAGPKEYTRLRHFPNSVDDVMMYSNNWYKRVILSGFFAPMMNILMNYMHGFMGNWGLAIVGMTLLLKIVTIPFTLASSRSARRMQKIHPELQAVREKYKDTPQKINQATMEIFKKHKINPMSGCLPALITMPLFSAFFFMLPSAAELRFQGFLWAHDLSAPDTVAHIMGFPLNILPFLACGAMLLQMHLVPTATADTTQARLMKWAMPVVLLVVWYQYSCALALYSTINNIFTACQQLIINRMRDTGDPADAVAAPAGGARPMKNITPAKTGKRK